MSLWLYFDEDSMQRILVNLLREHGFDCLTVGEEARRGRRDAEHLERSTSLGRVLFTKNTGDFRRLHTQWLSTDRGHAGIVALTDQRAPLAVVLDGLQNLAIAWPQEKMPNRFEFLLNYRSRHP